MDGDGTATAEANGSVTIEAEAQGDGSTHIVAEAEGGRDVAQLVFYAMDLGEADSFQIDLGTPLGRLAALSSASSAPSCWIVSARVVQTRKVFEWT